MSTAPACPQCSLDNTYADGAQWICADCGFEWSAAEAPANAVVVRDSNGNVLDAGDTVTVIKDLKVKGSSIPLKQGTGGRAWTGRSICCRSRCMSPLSWAFCC
ncbi:zinc ribbon domain-containing protein YjdM, partial [Xanthomonas campestris]|uniref:zinc ribbon domain-containing protein YjdM n=1 Tax=Xanthomonas campestris TaxID=339 RepID=UPI002B229192